MKKLIWQTLPALCVAGLLISVRAQDNPPGNAPVNGDNNNNNPATPQAAPQPGPGDAPPPPDNQGPPQDNQGQPQGQTPDNQAPTSDNNATAAGDTSNAPTVTTDNARPAVPEDQPAAMSAPLTNTSADAFMPPSDPGTNPDELRLNFKNAPLEMVLNYLSDAAGFIILEDTPVHGSVSVISSHSMTRDEAVDLLNDVLNRNGYAAIRDGRTLTIVSKDDAKTRNIPVKVSNDPDKIPNNAEIVTQIIPIRFVEAEQLAKDLSLFVSPQATIVANEAGNSIVITDTQSNIKHLVEIIKAVDSSAEGETQIKVFHLRHANPTDVANELAQIFPSNSGSSGTSTAPIRFGGGGGGGPGGFFARMMGGGGGGFGGGGGGGGTGGASSSSNARMQKQTTVLATADLRTSSVIVTASSDLMNEISGMMEQLDVPSARDQKVYVYHLDHGDPEQAVQVLQSMFSGTSGSSTGSRGGVGGSSSSTTSALQSRETQNNSSTGTSSTSSGIGGSTFGGGGGGGRGGGGF